MQAMDLMSLHYALHEYNRPKLSLAMLAFIHMRAAGLLIINQWTTIEQLEMEISAWAENQIDGPDDTFIIF